jgi:succinate dehydrogenase / fumarate reductase cytochrome b subunit
MSRVTALSRSSIGLKVTMAMTGIVLVLFVIVHMLGNLKIFLPAHRDAAGALVPALDVYGEFLRNAGAPVFPHGAALWIFRLVLLTCVVLHVSAAVVLTRMDWTARPVRYKQQTHQGSTYASRTQRWGGLIVGLFVVYHILHFTTGTVHPHFEPGHVRANVIAGFNVWPVSIAYIVAMVALGLHLYHGVWSIFQTLGVSHPRWNVWRRRLAAAIALIVALGNISIPVAVLTGIVH